MTTVAAVAPEPTWRRFFGFNLFTALALGIAGWFVGYVIGENIHGAGLEFYADTGQNDVAIMLGYFCGVIGFLVGLGFANYPIKRMLGHPPTLAERESV